MEEILIWPIRSEKTYNGSKMYIPDETVLQSLATVSLTRRVAGGWQVEQVRNTSRGKDD